MKSIRALLKGDNSRGLANNSRKGIISALNGLKIILVNLSQKTFGYRKLKGSSQWKLPLKFNLGVQT